MGCDKAPPVLYTSQSVNARSSRNRKLWHHLRRQNVPAVTQDVYDQLKQELESEYHGPALERRRLLLYKQKLEIDTGVDQTRAIEYEDRQRQLKSRLDTDIVPLEDRWATCWLPSSTKKVEETIRARKDKYEKDVAKLEEEFRDYLQARYTVDGVDYTRRLEYKEKSWKLDRQFKPKLQALKDRYESCWLSLSMDHVQQKIDSCQADYERARSKLRAEYSDCI